MADLLQHARDLRKNQTDVECLIWRHLRAKRFAEWKFKRQQPLGSYIVDFVCFEARLVIELDGGQHAEQIEYDAVRTRWLRAQRFTVLRFWNNDVIENLDGVMQTVLESLQAAPSPQPLPRQGGGA